MSEGGVTAGGASIGALTRSGLWITPDHTGRATSALALSRLYVVPFRIARATAFARLGIETTVAAAAGGVARVGVYSELAAHNWPDALVAGADTGAIDTTVAPGLLSAATAFQLASGLWFAAAVFQVALPTVRTTNTYGIAVAQASSAGGQVANVPFLDGVAGALPANIDPATGIAAAAPVISLQAA